MPIRGGDCDVSGYAEGDGYAYADSDSYGYAYADSDGNGYSYGYAYADSDSYGYAYADSDGYAYLFAYADSDAAGLRVRWGSGRADRVLGRHRGAELVRSWEERELAERRAVGRMEKRRY